MNEKEPIHIVIQIPFCTGHCVYCEEKSLGENVAYLERYRIALENEIATASEELRNYRIRSVHIRCDALSLMGLQAMDDFLGALEKRIPSNPDTQWTVDLQPQDLTEDLLYVLCDRHPVKAIRLELMAFSQRELLALHTPFTANLSEHALSFLTDHKETNRPFLLSVSLGIGIPGQSEDSFRKTLLRLLPAQPDQIVLKRFRNRRLSREEQLSLAEETDWSSYIRAAEEFLGSQGYLRSGNSLTFALPGRAFYADESDAKKMSQYGFGLGARTRLEGFSYANTDDYAFYVENSGNPELLIAH